MEAHFWLLIALASYSYAIYPLILLAMPKRRSVRKMQTPPLRSISVIIAARNEEAKIRSKIQNTLALRHSDVTVEVLVASDASDDGTDDIVRAFGPDGVILARSSERMGKEHAQSVAIAASSGELLLFTDAGTVIPHDALEAIVKEFSDPEVGALSSVDMIVSEAGEVQGEGLYVRYEMWLRRIESRFNTLVGLSGSFFCARRAICKDWDTRIPSDFGAALNCARLGYRATSSSSVVGIYRPLADPSKEYHRKFRTVVRGMAGLKHRSEVLNPFRYGRFAFQVISHKLMRWLVPWFLLAAFLVNLSLLRVSPLYVVTAIGLTGLFASPILLRLLPVLGNFPPAKIAAYFVEANVAIMHAAVRIAGGHAMHTWEPSKR